MIPFIDNIDYSGSQPNFGRDNMTWQEMGSVTDSTLDKGHIVFCTTTEYDRKGHYIFLGMVEDTQDPSKSVPDWSKITDKDGNIIGGSGNIESIPNSDIDALENPRPVAS